MYISDKDKLVGRNGYYLVEKVEDRSSGIRCITDKPLIERGRILDNVEENFQSDFKKNDQILYLVDYAIQIKDNIYVIKKDFIIASIL